MPRVTVDGTNSPEATDTLPERSRRRRRRRLALFLLFAMAVARSDPAVAQICVGDCNDDGAVEINELILGVNIALNLLDLSECANLDDGQGMVTVARLIAAVNSALCDCMLCATPAPGTATPTATPPRVTPTGTSVSIWTVDNYEVASSDCAGLIEDAVLNGLEELGPDFTVRQMGEQVEIEDSEGVVYEGTADPDGTVHVQWATSDSIGPCDYEVEVDASGNLSESSTTAMYDGSVDLSGFCVGLSDCSLQITARWRRLEGS
jgi:hypothetical protein